MKENDYKDFENQGWENMLQTLDREMPTKKKRRGLFWLFLALGLVAAGGGLWSLAHTTQPKPNSEVIENQLNKQPKTQVENIDSKPQTAADSVVANKTSDTPKRHIAELDKGEIVENMVQKTSNLGVIISKSNNSFINIEKTTNYNTIQSVEPFINSSIKTENSAVENSTSPINKSDLNNNPLVSTEKSEATKTFLEPIPTAKSVEIVAELGNHKPIAPLRIDSHFLNHKLNLNTIKVSKAKTPKGQLGITAGVHSMKLNRMDGFQAGLVYFQPISNRFSANIGLGFRQNIIESNRAIFYKLERAADPTAAATQLQKTSILSLDKIYYLEMPLQIQYCFHRKFAFSTGIKTAYLIDQKIHTEASSVYFVNHSGITLDKNNQFLMEAISSRTLGLKRLDAAWINQISYLPNKHIVLSFRYDLGFLNVLKQQNVGYYNRYLGLNASYLF